MFRRDKKRCVGTECGWKMWNTNIAMWRCEATIRHQPSRGSRAVRRFNRANHCLDYSHTQKCRRNATVAIWERGGSLWNGILWEFGGWGCLVMDVVITRSASRKDRKSLLGMFMDYVEWIEWNAYCKYKRSKTVPPIKTTQDYKINCLF